MRKRLLFHRRIDWVGLRRAASLELPPSLDDPPHSDPPPTPALVFFLQRVLGYYFFPQVYNSALQNEEKNTFRDFSLVLSRSCCN